MYTKNNKMVITWKTEYEDLSYNLRYSGIPPYIKNKYSFSELYVIAESQQELRSTLYDILEYSTYFFNISVIGRVYSDRKVYEQRLNNFYTKYIEE
jgi:hypothetical protein